MINELLEHRTVLVGSESVLSIKEAPSAPIEIIREPGSAPPDVSHLAPSTSSPIVVKAPEEFEIEFVETYHLGEVSVEIEVEQIARPTDTEAL